MTAHQLLSIGQLARRSGLTAKALRHYDRIGLLAPTAVDERSGSRLYAAGQVHPARLISRLRAVDLPLDEVRTCLNDPHAITGILRAHRRRLESRRTRISGDLHELQHLITDGWETTMTEVRPADVLAPEDERKLAVRLFNDVWTLMETENRSTEDDDRMLHMAHASRHHWGQVGSEQNLARGEWQCSRVYAVLRRAEPCLHHAQRVLDICQAHGIADWDLAFAYEALARGHAVAGDAEAARTMTERALAAVDGIAEDEDRALVISDLETIPGQPRFW